MGKNLRQQARGKGSLTYRAHGFRGRGDVRLAKARGVVVDIIDDPMRTAPLGVVKFETGNSLFLAYEGMKTGDKVGYDQGLKVGSVLELKKIPEGMPIYNIEITPGDGGKLVKATGTFATIVGKEKNFVRIKLPSRKIKILNEKCLATIGVVAGSGRVEKFFGKAGKKHHAMRARGKLYPITAGVAMNPVDHPFGGRTKPGKPKTSGRSYPPGKKVGNIAARRCGLKKK
jgi:large subunit ribosomal protein L2